MLQLEQLSELCKSEHSGVCAVKKQIRLCLEPSYLSDINFAILKCLNSHLNKYYPEVSGILLGYDQLKLKKSTGAMFQPLLHVDIQATFFLFCPLPGQLLSGIVNMKSRGHLGVLVLDTFNASIMSGHTPVNGLPGNEVSLGIVVRFKVLSVSYSMNRVVLMGEMVSETMKVKDTAVMVGIIGHVDDFEGDSDHDSGIENSHKEGEEVFAASSAASNSKKVIYVDDPIRRSDRKPKTELLKEKNEGIEKSLLAHEDTNLGLEIVMIKNKGRGIRAVRDFSQGEFVVEYAGELINIGTAKDLEVKYSMDASKGSYMYYFKHQNTQYCIDATGESGRQGRLLNHSRVSPNCKTKVFILGDTPRLIIVAKSDIKAGTELVYDYGDRSKESLKDHLWLAH